MKIGNVVGLILIGGIGVIAALNFIEEQKAKPELLRKHTHEIDAAQGLMAANVCSGWTSDSHRQLAWCKDYMPFVPSAPEHDEATVARWRDTFFASYCGDYERNPQKFSDRSWCNGYLKLLPGSKTFVGEVKLDRWLFEEKRYQYVCYNLPKNAMMTEPCRGYSYRPGLHSWHEAESAVAENAS